MSLKKKVDIFLNGILKEMKEAGDSDPSNTTYGISGTSIYADHNYVLELAINDQKELKKVFSENESKAQTASQG